jgi:hypothetical protein
LSNPNAPNNTLAAGSGFSVPVTGVSGGGQNTIIGRQSGQFNQNGTNNTMLGYRAGYQSNGSSNVFIGNQAGQNNSESNKLIIANDATATPLIEGTFSSSNLANQTAKINGKLQVTGQLIADGSINIENAILDRSGNNVTLRNSIAGTPAMEITFDSTGGTSNIFKFNGVMILTGSGPGSPTGGGNTGQMGFDSDYLYICINGGAPGSATWKRIPLETWT